MLVCVRVLERESATEAGARAGSKGDPRQLVPAIASSIPQEYDSAWGIGAVPSEIRLTAPMPWGGVEFLNTTRRIRLQPYPSLLTSLGIPC
jgi:hypothetical protein